MAAPASRGRSTTAERVLRRMNERRTVYDRPTVSVPESVCSSQSRAIVWRGERESCLARARREFRCRMAKATDEQAGRLRTDSNDRLRH